MPPSRAARKAAGVVRLAYAPESGSQEVLDESLLMLELGKTSYLDVLVAESNRAQARSNVIDARQNVLVLTSNLKRAVGYSPLLPLRAVPDAITPARLEAVIGILHRELGQRFGIARPRILVCGLNPHAGEAGHLGSEEIEVIAPVLETLRSRGMDLVGPLPADTLFTPRHLAGADAVLAMYHDQGLPVLKYAGFGKAVNVTLGLPIVRTSVDHGTALDLAGTGRADNGSLLAAVRLAAELAQP